MTIDTNLNIVCNLDFSLQYLYSRDEIEAGILWKMEICFIVDSELMSFLFLLCMDCLCMYQEPLVPWEI